MSKIRVLITDDEVELCDTLKYALEQKFEEYHISVAYSGSEALSVIKENDIDVLIADIRMPGITGIELIKRSKEFGKDFQSILLTGHGDIDNAIEALRLGASNFFQKPVSLDVLHYAILSAWEKIHLHRKLLESEHQYRTLFENANDAIFVYPASPPPLSLEKRGGHGGEFPLSMDVAACFLDVNNVACELLGYSREELMRLNIWDITAQKFIDRELSQIENIMQGGCAVFESAYISNSEDIIPVEISSRLIQYSGKPMILILARDIRERKMAEREKEELQSQLRQAQKMEAIGTLAGGIAHDFNNILFPIIGYTEIAIDELPKDHPVQSDLNGILKASYRARDLVKQILTFSRQREKEYKPLKIQPLIREVIRLIRPSFPSTIQIEHEIDENCGDIIGDPAQIHQVIMNLCVNAYHAMEEKGGMMKIILEQVELDYDDIRMIAGMSPGKYARITVTDTGKGMTPDVIDRIFDPYFTTKEPGKGTGLGLAIVHGIVVSKCKGNIKVYSEPGKGSSFHIYLPLTSEIKSFPENMPEEQVKGGTERILLVDDELEIVLMCRQMIEKLGYQVTTRTSSIEALELFRVKPYDFDLVITDLTMPNMTGIELVNSLLLIRNDIPIILCSGFGEMITDEQIKLIGLRSFIMKPVIKRELAEAIRNVLDSPPS